MKIRKLVSRNFKAHADLAGTLNNLGNCLMKLNELDEAKQCLEQSKEIKEKVSRDPKKDADFAGTLNNLGNF